MKSTQTYILNNNCVYQVIDDNTRVMRKTITERKNAKTGIQFTSHWRVNEVSTLTFDELQVLDELTNNECECELPEKEVKRVVTSFGKVITHHICKYNTHYSYHVTIGDLEESMVIAKTKELLADHRYGIGSLIKYLE